MSGESAEFLFVVRLHEDGAPWVALRPKHKGRQHLKAKSASIFIAERALREAKQLVRFLNSNIKALSYSNCKRESSSD